MRRNTETTFFKKTARPGGAFLFILLTLAAAHAATYTVTTNADSGAGSLRDAVTQANATAAPDTIIFNIPAASCNATTGVCTITLASEITISNNGSLTINGTGADRLTIDGGAGTNRIFYSDQATFTLRGATLTGGNGAGASFNGNGGAIYVNAGTTVFGSVYFTGNNATGATGNGGGAISFNGGTNRIENCTFSSNSSYYGNAVYGGFADITFVNSTFSGNTGPSGSQGGAINQNFGSTTLNSCTIGGNTATSGGGVYRENGTLVFGNTIIAGNVATQYPEIYNNNNTVTSQGYNLIGDGVGTGGVGDSIATNVPITYQSTDIQNTPPFLDAFANNSGTVPTRLLQPGSPAIDKGNSALAGTPALDARGVVRPYDTTIANAAGGNGADIGASELIPIQTVGWGLNNLGQIGDNTTTNRSLPTLIFFYTSIAAIEGGQYHALGLRSDGTVLTWGYNLYGQLGDNTTTNRSAPATVSGLTNVVATAGGQYHSLALLADGTIRAWGYNANGQLGDGTTTQRLTPVTVSGITNAVAIAAGASSSYALLADGSVKAWGYNLYGQLGDGTTVDKSTPVTVSGLSGGVAAMDAGGYSGYAIKTDGSLVAWGANFYGQLGDGTTTNRLTPVAVLNLTSGVVQIAGGIGHAAALKANGTVLTWGDDQLGQLGDGAAGGSSATPTAIALANVVEIKSNIAYNTAARLRDGSIRAWGLNYDGEIGNGTTNTTGCQCQPAPTAVPIDAGIGFFGFDGNTGRASSPLASVAAGANQFVRLGDATVNFANVATAGKMQIRTFDPSTTGLTLPTGYTIVANSNGYSITSTAQSTGTANVCVKATNVIDQTTFNRLSLLHDDNFDGALDAGTTTRDYQKRELCRPSASFSPFVIALEPGVPTAGSVSVSGRVTVGAKGAGLTNAVISITDAQGITRRVLTSSFGYYRFDNVETGQNYTIAVESKKYRFTPQIVNVADELTDVNFYSGEARR